MTDLQWFFFGFFVHHLIVMIFVVASRLRARAKERRFLDLVGRQWGVVRIPRESNRDMRERLRKFMTGSR